MLHYITLTISLLTLIVSYRTFRMFYKWSKEKTRQKEELKAAKAEKLAAMKRYQVNPEANMRFYFDPRFKEASRFVMTAINSRFNINITREIFNELFIPPAINDDNSYNSSLIKIKDGLPMAILNKQCKLLFYIESNTVRPTIRGKRTGPANFINNRFRLEAEGMGPFQSLHIDEELFKLMFIEYDPSKEVTVDIDNTISTENIISLNKQKESSNESN